MSVLLSMSAHQTLFSNELCANIERRAQTVQRMEFDLYHSNAVIKERNRQ